MLGRFLLPISIVLAGVAAAVPANYVCEIENGFDYKDNDVENVPGKAEECCDKCFASKKGCTAWSWNNYNNGTCWLKSKADQIVVNPDVKSARCVYEIYGSDSCYIFKDVDFVGNDIGNKPAAKAEQCCEICQKTLGCRAYSWSDYQKGTCWLKSKRSDQVVFKAGVKSAEVYPSGNPFPTYTFAIEQGVDYADGNNVASMPGKDPAACIENCKKQTKCEAFSWSNYQGGYCWLKMFRRGTVANPAVTSGVVVSPVKPESV